MDIYQHHQAGLLIDRDYDPLYSDSKIVDSFLAKKISKSKYSDYKDGKIDFICDDDCRDCPYRYTCMVDDKII
jgi:hypothetical protein